MTQSNPTLQGFLHGLFTKQQVIDYVDQQLEIQGKPASITIGNSTSCLLKANNGCKCAIGHLIPDEELDQRIDHDIQVAFWSGRTYAHYFYPNDDKTNLTYYDGLKFLEMLQDAHDTTMPDNDPRPFIQQYRDNLKEELQKFMGDECKELNIKGNSW